MQTQGEILSKYLKEHVFFVPPTAILAISPIEVPIPVKRKEDKASSSNTAMDTGERAKKTQKSDANAPKNTASLKTVLTQIHKSEYFLSRLKQLHEENEQYLQVLQSILHSLLQLDEMTKANGTCLGIDPKKGTFERIHSISLANHDLLLLTLDTETAIQQIFQTLQSSTKLLFKIQTELQQRGISSNINITSPPEEVGTSET